MRLLTVTVMTAIVLAACSAPLPRYPAASQRPLPAEPSKTAAVTHPADPSEAADSSPDADASPIADASAEPSAAGPAFDTSAWTHLAPSGEAFTILMPARAEQSEGSVNTPGGKAVYTTWAATDASKRAFSVTRVRLPSGLPPNAPAGPIYEQAATSILSSVKGGKIDRQTDATVGTAPARRIVIAASDVAVVCLVVIAANGDVVTPCAASSPTVADDGSVDAFLASFSIS